MIWHFFTHLIFSKRAGALVRRIASLSVVAISLSVAAFFIVLFVMNGMNQSIQTRLIGLEPHLYVTIPGLTKTSMIESHPVYQRLLENKENKTYLYESQDVIIRTIDGQFRGATARGVSPESLAFMIEQLKNIDKSKKHQNVSFSWDRDEMPGAGEIVVGVDLARTLGIFEGDMVTIIPPESLLLPPGEIPIFEKVKVKKIVSTNLSDLDAQYIFYQRDISLKAFNQSASLKRGLEVWMSDSSKADSLQENVQKFDGVQAETWKQRNSALFYALLLEKISIGMFLGLAGMIAGSSILTVLALLLSQKRRDIAILRTIGLSAQNTVKLFTQIGFLLSALGIGIGTLVGVGISYYIQFNPINILPDIYYDSQIPAKVDIVFVLAVLIASAAFAFIGSWIPARTTLEIEPSQALRIKN